MFRRCAISANRPSSPDPAKALRFHRLTGSSHRIPARKVTAEVVAADGDALLLTLPPDDSARNHPVTEIAAVLSCLQSSRNRRIRRYFAASEKK